jgi:Asp-tRNA(Asn)/Glu-tRNA(Gln) amidotransferase A subunit family amidase
MTTQPSPDATELLRRMLFGERSSVDIVREHLDRIDREQPRLNAATEILRDEALTQAENPVPGPLSGLPITLKETYGLAGHEITGGSARMPPIAVAEDAPVVQKLKAAGAIFMSRSNLPEFFMTA